MNQRYGASREGSKWSWIGLIVLIVLCGIVYYLWQQRQAPEPPPEPVAEEPQAPAPLAAAPAAPAIEHPLPTPEPVVPGAPELPPLESSDTAAREALAAVVNPKLISDWLFGTELIRRVVVTVDNLPRESLPMSLRLVKPVPGTLATNGAGDEKALSPDNYGRYAALLKIAEAINPRALAEVYIRFYPLLQQQYRTLGYPDAYFNDAMVRAIDSLMRTPDIREPIKLVQPKVLYKFADPTLENLSIGQRMLLRMGPDNVARAKQVLRGFRQEITGRAPKP